MGDIEASDDEWPYPLPRSGRDAISALDAPPPSDLFREYDLRGLVDAPFDFDPGRLNPFVANRLGRAFGTYLRDAGIEDVVVGYDSRAYSPLLAEAFSLGLLSTGAEVVEIGLATTPLVYFAQHHLGVAGGVSVTASHNPNGWSGFKLSSGLSTTLGPEEIASFGEVANSGDFARGRGTYVEHSVTEAYIAHLAAGSPATSRMTIAIDGANSISGVIADAVFRAAGYVTVPVNLELDWTFPNHEPDPELVASRQQLADAVLAKRAAFGIALDGDGDRLGVTDELGSTVLSDRVLALLALDVLERHPGATIVYDVKCSRLVEDVIRKAGGEPVMWKTGHSHIKSRMRELDAPFAGERSGHFFNAVDYFGFDDGIHAGLRLADLVSRRNASLSQLISELPQYFSSPTMQAACADRSKYQIVERAAELAVERLKPLRTLHVNGARLEFDDGWLLFRASSNVPGLVVVCEGTTERALKEMYCRVRNVLDEFDEVSRDWSNDPFGP